MARTERAWQLFSRRFGLLVTNPVREMAEYVQPVIVAGSPDFTDPERPLYIAGAEQTPAAGDRSAIGLVANVACVVKALTIEVATPGGRVQLFTLSPQERVAFDPVATAQTDVPADVTPGGQPANDFIRGFRTASRGANLTFTGDGGSDAPTEFADLILPAGFSLWTQTVDIDRILVVSMFWREFNFAG